MVKIGIIGTGSMANTHADNLIKQKGARVIACCDISAERAAAFASKWRIAQTYTNYEKMLDNKDLDGVSIVTSDAAHAPVSIAAIRRGIGVLCEKPLASTLKDARAMAAAARKAGVVNLINFSKRNSAGLQEMARRIRQGDLGEVRHFEARYLQGWANMNWKGAPENGGGVWRISTANGNAGTLSDLGCHLYDAARFLCGDFAKVSCRFMRYDKGIGRIGRFKLDAPDSFFTTIAFSNGVVGQIHSTRWAVGYGDVVQIIVSGTKGSFEFDIHFAPNGNGYRWYSAKSKKWVDVSCKPQPSTYERFVRALQTGKNGEPSFADGLAIQTYLDASILSDKLEKPVAFRK